MASCFKTFIAALAGILFFCAPSFAYDRIVSLYPGHTENIAALGAADKLVGISQNDSSSLLPNLRTYKVTVIMTQPENVRILPGMTVLVTAVLPTDTTTDTGFAVPLEAIVGDISGHSWVWLYQEDGTVKKVPVTTDEFRSSNILVSGNLKAGDRVISSGARGLRESSKVHIISE